MPGNNERQRRIARQKHERQQQLRRARQARNRRRFLVVVTSLAAIGLVLGLVFAFLPGGKKAPSASASHSASPSASATPTVATVAEPAHHCTYKTATPVSKKVSFPPATPDYTGTYAATIKTSVGDIKLNLLNSKATCTVNSFVHLAEQGFFNNTQCHRMLTSGIFVLQCGDAFATASTKLDCGSSSKVGSGMPGYEYASENLAGAKYGPGVVAMANEGAGTVTNGSQFFFIYQDSTAGLTNSGQAAPAYTPFATVSSGLDIVQNVAKDGFSCQYPSSSGGGGVPKEKVIIDSVTIQKT